MSHVLAVLERSTNSVAEDNLRYLRMRRLQQIICILGIILLLSLCALSLISAIFYNEGFDEVFSAAIYSTIVIPVLLFAMIHFAKVIKGSRKDSSEDTKEDTKEDTNKDNN